MSYNIKVSVQVGDIWRIGQPKQAVAHDRVPQKYSSKYSHATPILAFLQQSGETVTKLLLAVLNKTRDVDLELEHLAAPTCHLSPCPNPDAPGHQVHLVSHHYGWRQHTRQKTQQIPKDDEKRCSDCDEADVLCYGSSCRFYACEFRRQTACTATASAWHLAPRMTYAGQAGCLTGKQTIK
jgi:hypothetical protein